ncbi:MAG TPA: IS110 family transposase [Candidatus Saccharimonadales bacterium]|nr:IS110 family transposase [Candidatus Saccharimonadales bacterium]
MFYSGIDLSARVSHLCVVDETLSILLQQKVANDLPLIAHLLGPFKPHLKIVVESTFNWYWLVDGLQALGFDVSLAHTLGLSLITHAKVKSDRRDAFALAKLLRAGLIPYAYIYPASSRPVRDLLRRRLKAVALRAQEYGSLRQLLLRQGILSTSRNQIKLADDTDLEAWFSHPLVVLSASQQLERIHLLSRQIAELEQQILDLTRNQAEYKRLLEISGIGKILALTILYEIGEISRFKDVRHFSSYCRLVPGVAQSGAVSRRGRASKQGNAYLKSAFNQAAVVAVRSYPAIKRCYQRHLQRHRGSARKLVAYNVIAHKLAQAVYFVLKRGEDYREELLFGI